MWKEKRCLTVPTVPYRSHRSLPFPTVPYRSPPFPTVPHRCVALFSSFPSLFAPLLAALSRHLQPLRYGHHSVANLNESFSQQDNVPRRWDDSRLSDSVSCIVMQVPRNLPQVLWYRAYSVWVSATALHRIDPASLSDLLCWWRIL
jgi:hypothetical protein